MAWPLFCWNMTAFPTIVRITATLTQTLMHAWSLYLRTYRYFLDTIVTQFIPSIMQSKSFRDTVVSPITLLVNHSTTINTPEMTLKCHILFFIVPNTSRSHCSRTFPYCRWCWTMGQFLLFCVMWSSYQLVCRRLSVRYLIFLRQYSQWFDGLQANHAHMWLSSRRHKQYWDIEGASKGWTFWIKDCRPVRCRGEIVWQQKRMQPFHHVQ